MPDALLALFDKRHAEVVGPKELAAALADQSDSVVGIVLGSALANQLRQRLRFGPATFRFGMCVGVVDHRGPVAAEHLGDSNLLARGGDVGAPANDQRAEPAA